MRETSLNAYKELVPTKTEQLRAEICELLKIRPMTHEELIDALDQKYSPSGIRARCSELLSEEHGYLVRASGKYKPSRHGKPMIVWELNEVDPNQMELF